MENQTEDTEPPVKQFGKILTNSWEAELLISGGALVSLIQFSDYLKDKLERFNDIADWQRSSAFIGDAPFILVLFFSIHVVARGFWLALIFLKRLYPNGINLERLHFVELFKSRTAKFDFDKRIESLDKFCSLLFAWAVTLIVMAVGVGILFAVASLPNKILALFSLHYSSTMRAVGAFVTNAIYGTFGIYVIDVFLFGFLRRFRFIGRIYLPIYLFWNNVSLGFIWLPNFQIIFSNAKHKWMTGGLLCLILIVGEVVGGGGLSDFMDERKHKLPTPMLVEYNYEDKSISGEIWHGATIQSEVITDNHLIVFLSHNWVVDWFVEARIANHSGDEFIRLKKDSTLLYSDGIKLLIDDSTYLNTVWVGVGKNNGQSGIQTVLDISHLEKKLHILKIDYTVDSYEIPFWKQ